MLFVLRTRQDAEPTHDTVSAAEGNATAAAAAGMRVKAAAADVTGLSLIVTVAAAGDDAAVTAAV